MPRQGPPEGVDLRGMPEWIGNAVTAYHAIDQVFTALIEDERLGAEGGSVRERRARLIHGKAQYRAMARFSHMLTGNPILGKFHISTDLAGTPQGEEREKFYLRHTDMMKQRIRNLTKILDDAGKKVPKQIVVRMGDRALMLEPHTGELFEIGIKTRDFGITEVANVDTKNRKPVDPLDWFRVRWDDQILNSAKKLTPAQKTKIIGEAHL